MTDHPTTNGGRLLKRGDTFDIECHRTTHRLRVGQGILRSLGLTAEYPKHAATCILSAEQAFNRAGRDRYSFRCECGVGHDPQPVWPAYATGKTFDLAYQLADEMQTERGRYHQRQIDERRRAA